MSVGSNVMEIPSLPLKYIVSYEMTAGKVYVLDRCPSYVQRIKENYCTKTRTNSRHLFKGGTQSVLDVCHG